MYYNLFLEIGLATNSDHYIYDQDTGIVLKYEDKYMKMSFTDNVYAGRNDMVFDPISNYKLIVTLLGYYIEKESNSGNDIGYIADFKEEEGKKGFYSKKERYKQRVVIKTKYGDLFTNFYYNLYLAYIEAIFILSGESNYDLSNFDILPEA